MVMIVARFILSLVVLASGSAFFVIAGSPGRALRDPALKFVRIPFLVEIPYAAIEMVFLLLQMVRVTPPAFLSPLSDTIQLSFGIVYIFYMYQIWRINGLSLTGYIPLYWVIIVTAVNYLLFALQYLLPAGKPAILIANKAISGLILLYAGGAAIVARSRKVEFLPSTRGGFWMAFFCLAYFPFVGIADMYTLPVLALDQARSVSLQLFPLRELIVLMIYALHLEPLYSRLWGARIDPDESYTPREREIAALLLSGMGNGEIAEVLNLSIPTVKSHVRNILRKNGACTRLELTGPASPGLDEG